MDVPLHRRQQDFALRTTSARRLFRFNKWDQVGNRLFHDARAFYDLRQEHFPRAEKVSHHVHAVHQRPFNHLNRARKLLPRLFRIRHDVIPDALHQGVRQPCGHGQLPPRQIRLRRLPFAAHGLRKGHQPLGGVGAAVKEDVFHAPQQFFVQFFVDGELSRVDDAHVHAGIYRVIQKSSVNRLAHRVVAAKGKGHIADAAADQRVRQLPLNQAHRLEVGQGVLVMFLNARTHGENIGVENDVLRRKPHLLREQAIGAPADAEFARHAVRLPFLVKGHHNHRRAIAPRQPRLAHKFRFPFLQADGVDHALTLGALQSRFDHRPFGRVNDNGHAGDVWLAGDQVEERGHRFFGVQHPLVHVHVNHLRPALHLLPRHAQRLLVPLLADEAGKFARAGDVGAFADVHEVQLARDI